MGLCLTAAFAAVLFLAQRLFGAPFLPFDLFDWLARVLPGRMVTFGIDTIVDVILVLNLGDVSEVAKTAEQGLAIGLFWLLGGVVAAAIFAATGRGRSAVIPSVAAAVALATGTFLASLAVNTATAARPVLVAAWIFAAFLAWGYAIGWSRQRLAEAATGGRAAEGRDPERAPAERGREPATGAPTDDVASAHRVDRRRFLIRLGGATALVTVAGTGVGALLRSDLRSPAPVAEAPEGAWSSTNPLPNAGAAVEPAPGTRPEFTPVEDHYRIDINTTPPDVDGEAWELQVDGLVDAPSRFTLEDLRGYPSLDQFITLSCISNRLGGDLIGTQRWTGVSLQRLLPDLGLSDDATHLRISSVDGFYEIVSLETIRADERVMLTYAWNGLPLPRRNGYPLRIYVPNVYGMKQPKWIDRIEAIPEWQAGFWVERGWDRDARMRTTSVIDTVATNLMIEGGGDGQRIPVGGIAHAGDRGIRRVEVRVDDGEWQEARLRRPLSEKTWVIWRYDWPFEAGRHTLTVRCVDGTGTPQIAERNPVRPSGATGLISEDVMLSAGAEA